MFRKWLGTCLWSLLWLPWGKGTYLVLQGYSLIQVSRDNNATINAKDGVHIHSGDHLHDPCSGYVDNGERFLLQGQSPDQGKGFVVVNDCQVVECTKWTDASEENFGGETIVYDLVKLEDETKMTRTWRIADDGRECACDQNGRDAISPACHIGKFALVDFWNPSQCQTDFAVQTSSFISCVAIQEDSEGFLGMVQDLEEHVDLDSDVFWGVLGALAACFVCGCICVGCYCWRSFCRQCDCHNDKWSFSTDDDEAVLEDNEETSVVSSSECPTVNESSERFSHWCSNTIEDSAKALSEIGVYS